MGADFLYGICEIPVDAQGKSLDAEVVERKLHAVVSAMSAEDVEYMLLERYGEEEGDREELVKKLLESFNYLDAGGRDVGFLELKGTRYWISGGMSGGDTPTEAMDHIWALAELGDEWWKVDSAVVTVQPIKED